MSVDLIQLLAQNIGPVTVGLTGVAGSSAAALAYYIYKRRDRFDEIDLRSVVPDWRERDINRLFGVLRGIPVSKATEGALREAIERIWNGSHPVPLALPIGAIPLTASVALIDRARLVGRGVTKSRLVSTNGSPAIYANGVEDCAVANVGLEGGVVCRESEVMLRGCEVTCREGRAGIDAADGSMVTFSGRIVTAPGGVAIRARSGSRVVLEAPFEIQPNDPVVFEPGCEVLIA